jgi:hypothetical protein
MLIDIECLCLCGLFFLARDDRDHASAIPQGVCEFFLRFQSVCFSFPVARYLHKNGMVVMVVLIVIVALYHALLNSAYWPLVANLPISLAPKIEKNQGYAYADQPYSSPEAERSGSAEALGNGKGSSRLSPSPTLFFVIS